MHSDLRTLLGQIPLFGAFGDDVLERLASRSLLRTFRAGHLLFATGEPCRGLYVVESGRVRNVTRGTELTAKPLPPQLLSIVTAGGIYPLLEKEGLIAPKV